MKPAVAILILSATLASAKTPDLVDVKVYPPNASLTSATDRQSIVVQASYSDSTTRDVTAKATFALADKTVATLDKSYVLLPLADGKTELRVKFAGRTLTVPVEVKNAKAQPAISFTKDVMPVFMKSGCNTGACHGAARGKDGFRLSLFGFDPEGDYFRLTREWMGRRINLALPEDSLILEKGAGRVTHTGGKRFAEDSLLYQTLLAWLKAGAPKDPADVARVTGIEVFPKQAVLEGSNAVQRLTVRATYSDGTDRDVTRQVVFLSNNDVAAKVSSDGVVTSAKTGEAFVMARYESFTVGTQVLSIPRDPKFAFPKLPEDNYVDTLVNAKLRKIRILPSELCDDATFIRRAHLDIVGSLPTPEETRKFVADTDAKKREKTVDELLGRKEFAKLWVMKWAELLQIRTEQNKFFYKSAVQYYTWLEDQFARNEPINRVVQNLIAAKGGTFRNPAANFYKVETDLLKLTENASQVFLGMRIQCAQCHNHPFDRWRMDDYYSFAAFFAQIGRKQGEDQRETVIFNSGNGGVKHPVGGRDMKPKFLGAEVPEIKPGEDRREVLAKWLASPQNPQFARNVANIVWAHFLGKGIVDPVDDVRISNPPSNPELLDALAEKLTSYNYDLRKVVRDICTSRTYQLSSVPNATNAEDTRNFAKAGVRRMRAEVLLDVINQITETKEKFRGLPLGARAVEIADGKTTTYFLTTFGRATRDTVCACEVKMEPSLSQALHLLNGETVNSKVNEGGLVKRLLKEGKTPPQVIEEIYLRCFSRPPTAKELTKLEGYLKEGTPQEVLNDVFWAVLNSKEFVFNH
ncbi:MAG: DUF1549 domain-containing protein [Verrucomicrobia bacterium]|nr:DUF1549 domain-containing protein [Verrucomicrobiota bacterium]